MSSQQNRNRADFVLALIAILGAVLAIGLWIPFDTDSGLTETVRRQVRVGDALGPTVAAGFVLLGGLVLLLRKAPSLANFSDRNLTFLVMLVVGFAICILVMRWTGPAAVAIFGDEAAVYRNLRDTAPWKYLGFLLGGWLLVFAMIARAERRLSLRAGVIALIAVLALIAVYDLPFDDLLLPPNGDV
ncbi:MAG: hypothetical protein AAGA70_13380 [Pseudomonadota bacterium]